MEGCFKFGNVTVSNVISGRSRGVSRTMYQTKRALKQAVIFTSDHVYKLEKAVADSSMDDFHLLFGGFMPF